MNYAETEELISLKHPHVRSARKRFIILIILVMIASVALVSVAMALYSYSGAAQLDLSRPGYQSVRAQATHTDQTSTFPENGDLNSSVYKQFDGQYQALEKQVNGVNAFGGPVMDDSTLQIDAPAATPPVAPTTPTAPASN